jgi:hypothetical protein
MSSLLPTEATNIASIFTDLSKWSFFISKSVHICTKFKIDLKIAWLDYILIVTNPPQGASQYKWRSVKHSQLSMLLAKTILNTSWYTFIFVTLTSPTYFRPPSNDRKLSIRSFITNWIFSLLSFYGKSSESLLRIRFYGLKWAPIWCKDFGSCGSS